MGLLSSKERESSKTHAHINLHECQDKSDISCHSFNHIVSDFLSLLLCIVIFSVLLSSIVFFPSCSSSLPSLTHILYSCPILPSSILLSILLFSPHLLLTAHYTVYMCVCVFGERERVGGWESFLLSQSTVLLLTLACYLQTVFSLAAVPICRREGGYTDVAAAMFTYGKVIKFEENWMLKHCWLHEKKTDTEIDQVYWLL